MTKILKTKILFIVISMLLLINLTSCSLLLGNLEKETNNNITNKVVEVEDFTITDFEMALQTAIEKAEESVISIVQTEGGWIGSASLGSGVVVKRKAILKDETKGEVTGNILEYKYYAVTNRHVVETSNYRISSSLKVYLGNGNQVVNAVCEKYAEKEDLALIYFTSSTYIPIASLADTTKLKKGSFAIAIGSPHSLEYYASATFGIISFPVRYLEDYKFILGRKPFELIENVYIQHDAAINAGNSGGGLFNIEGKLIGINTQKLQSDYDSNVEGMGFSIPTHIIKEVFKDYL